MPKKNQKSSYLELVKRGFTFAYPVALVVTIIAILFKSKAGGLTPGFQLMVFAATFFAYVSLILTSLFFLLLKWKKRDPSASSKKTSFH